MSGAVYRIKYTLIMPKATGVYAGLLCDELTEAADVLQWALDKARPTAELDVSARLAARTAMEVLRGCSVIGKINDEEEA